MTQHLLHIRPYEAQTDLKPLSAIWFDASLRAHPFIGRSRLLEQRRLIEEVYLPQAETSVACQGVTPVGFISLLDTFVGGLFVAPVAPNMGVGHTLICHAFDRTGELTLEVYSANEQAIRFYRALGFSEISRRAVDDDGYPFPNVTLCLTRYPATRQS